MRIRRKAEEIIREYIDNGYELVLNSEDPNEVERLRLEYRSNGFDARWWTLKDAEYNKYHVLYAKKRPARKLAVKMTSVQIQANFEKMTVKELKSYCQKKNIKGYYKMNKSEMIRALMD